MIRRHARRTALLASLATLAVLAVACGNDDGDSTPATTAAPATTTAAASGATTAAPTTTAAPDPKADWPDKLVLGAVPSEESTSLQQSYDPLIKVLERDLGIPVEFFQATDYAGIIEAQIAGKVDLAQYGPFAYVIAGFNGAKIEPVGALVDGPDETPGYQSYGIAVSSNAEVNSLADFAGKKVCFVDPASTSGYLYPAAGLIAEGIDPESGVTPVFAGGHDASVLSVKNGDCDAGFAFDAMVDSVLIEAGDIAEGEIKTVWKSEVIAGSPIAVRTELPATLLAEIKRIVLEEANTPALVESGICASVDTCGITDENAWGWLEVADDFYDGVRFVCEQTKSAKCEG